MSSILDALRKSELTRRLGHVPVYRDGAHPVQTTLLRGLSIAAGVVLLAALGLSAWLLNRPEGMTAPAAPVESTAAAAAATVPGEPGRETAARSATSPNTREQTRVAPSFAEAAGTLRSEAVPVRASKPVAPPAVEPEEAPWLSALPDEFRASLPPLMVNIHVYAPEEGQRILYINNRPLKRGQDIDGVVVEEIVPEGVVLRARGQRFRIPRPS